MKNKLISALGGLGLIIYYIVALTVYVLPFVMIGAPFWLNILLFLAAYCFPLSNIIFWIWGLVCAIKGIQDIWAIIYYILFAVMFAPFFISIVAELLSDLFGDSNS